MFTLGAVFILSFLGLSTSASHDAGGDHFETALQDVMEHIVRNRRAIEWIDATGKTSLTQAEIKLIVDVHNSYRSVIEPTAADMIELTWDNDIANFAQTHLNKCTGKHNPDRKLDPWGSMGENMYFIPGNRYSDKQAMELWWVEGEDFVISSVTCNHQYTCNHFKAMAWAKTTKIGCGVKKCDVITENTNLQPPQTIFMCNYNKPVYSGAKPYTTGASCSACPAEFPKCRHNLCVTQAMLDSGAGFDGNTTVIGVTPIDNGGDGGDNGGGDGGDNGGDGGNNGGGDGGDNGDSGGDDSAPFTASASYFVCLIFLSLAILLK